MNICHILCFRCEIRLFTGVLADELRYPLSRLRTGNQEQADIQDGTVDMLNQHVEKNSVMKLPVCWTDDLWLIWWKPSCDFHRWASAKLQIISKVNLHYPWLQHYPLPMIRSMITIIWLRWRLNHKHSASFRLKIVDWIEVLNWLPGSTGKTATWESKIIEIFFLKRDWNRNNSDSDH